jgi:ketosteroid isomerase-like protein
MDNTQKKRIVMGYFEAAASRDLDRMISFLTDDFTLWMAPSAREQGLPIPLVGRERFVEFLQALRGRSDMWKVREQIPAQFLYDEDSAAVRVRSIGEFPNGAVYDNEYVFIFNIFKFEGGKISEMREFTDVAYIDILRRRAAATSSASPSSV